MEMVVVARGRGYWMVCREAQWVSHLMIMTLLLLFAINWLFNLLALQNSKMSFKLKIWRVSRLKSLNSLCNTYVTRNIILQRMQLQKRWWETSKQWIQTPFHSDVVAVGHLPTSTTPLVICIASQVGTCLDIVPLIHNSLLYIFLNIDVPEDDATAPLNPKGISIML